MSKKKTSTRVPASVSGVGPMSIDLLTQITALMKDNDLNTLDVRDGDRRIILKRGAVFVTTSSSSPQPVHGPPVSGASVHPAQSNNVAAGSTAADEDEKNLTPVKSPMVGTFYSSPSPDAKAFVTVGSVVNADTDVCIIEAMKVFNNIKAETSGVIAKILVNNGQTVEFGQTLFLVKPA